MSQFYASIRGNRGEATRMGTKSSGMSAHVRGWGVGVQVYLSHSREKDRVQVYKTSGSNGGANDELLIEYSEDGILFVSPELRNA